ncbi:hypothetical protein BaRGS_00015336, partial [Batillaria attramentaria]
GKKSWRAKLADATPKSFGKSTSFALPVSERGKKRHENETSIQKRSKTHDVTPETKFSVGEREKESAGMRNSDSHALLSSVRRTEREGSNIAARCARDIERESTHLKRNINTGQIYRLLRWGCYQRIWRLETTSAQSYLINISTPVSSKHLLIPFQLFCSLNTCRALRGRRGSVGAGGEGDMSSSAIMPCAVRQLGSCLRSRLVLTTKRKKWGGRR